MHACSVIIHRLGVALLENRDDEDHSAYTHNLIIVLRFRISSEMDK